jgi:adenine-specific DNA glycosylase
MPASKKPVVFKDTVWPLALIRRHGKILLHRRAAHGLLSGLWDLPGGRSAENGTIATLLNGYLADLKVNRVRPTRIGEIRHAITRWRIRAPVYLFDIDGNTLTDLPGGRWRWIRPSKVKEQATSSMTAKAVALLSSYEKNSR